MNTKSISTSQLGVTTHLLNDFIEREDSGTLTNKIQRLFRKREGRALGLVGNYRYRDVGISHYNHIDKENVKYFIENVKTKYLTKSINRSGESILVLSDSSVKKRGWVRKQFSKVTRGVTHFKEAKEVRRTAREVLISKLYQVMSSLQAPSHFSEEAKDTFREVLQKWNSSIVEMIRLEIKAYTQGTGKQHLKVHKLLRLSLLVDKLTEYALFEAHQSATQVHEGLPPKKQSDAYITFEKVLKTTDKYKKSGGLHVLHNFLGSLSKKINSFSVREQSLRAMKYTPKTTDRLLSILSALNTKADNFAEIPNLLKLDIASLCFDLIKSIPSPISTQMKSSFEEAMKLLQNTMQLDEGRAILPKDIEFLSVSESKREVHINDAHAQEVLFLIKDITVLFAHLAQGEDVPSLINKVVEKATWAKNSQLTSLWDYACSVYDILNGNMNFIIDDVDDSIYEKAGYLSYTARLLELQKASTEVKENTEYAESLIRRTDELLDAIQTKSQNVKGKRLGSIILEESKKVNLNKHNMRAKRILSGLRKTLFSSSTVASKIFRRASTTASLIGGAVAVPIAGVQLASLPQFSNGDMAIIVATQVREILTRLGITSIPLLANLAFSLSSKMIAQAFEEQKSEIVSNSLSEKQVFLTSWLGNTSQDLHLYNKLDVKRTLRSKGIPDSPIDTFFDEAVKQNIGLDECMSKVKQALLLYLPQLTKTPEPGIISNILKALYALNQSPNTDNKSYIYQGIFGVILPYIKGIREPQVAQQCYKELQAFLFDDSGNYVKELLFVLPTERPNTRRDLQLKKRLEQEIIKGLQKQQDGKIKETKEIYFALKRNVNEVYALFDETQELIHNIDFSQPESLTPWQKEFTPTILNMMVTNSTPEEIRKHIIAYMNTWLTRYRYELKGFIAYMIYVCSQMNDVYSAEIIETKKGLEYHPSMKYFIIQTILSYLKDIPRVFEDKARVRNIVEALYMIADPSSLQHIVENGLITSHNPSLNMYHVRDSQSSQHALFCREQGLSPTSLYFPYSMNIVASLQSLWNRVNPQQETPLQSFINRSLTSLYSALQDSDFSENTQRLEQGIRQVNRDLYSEILSNGNIDELCNIEMSDLIYALIDGLHECINDASCDQARKDMLNRLLISLFQMICPALDRRRENSGFNSLLKDNHTLSASLELYNEAMFSTIGVPQEHIQQTANMFRVLNMYISSLPAIPTIVSPHILSRLVATVMEALQGATYNKSVHPDVVESRITSMQKVFHHFFSIIKGTEWSDKNQANNRTPFASMILAFIEHIERFDLRNNPGLVEITEALIHALCIRHRDNNTLKLRNGQFIYRTHDKETDDKNNTVVCGQILHKLEKLSVVCSALLSQNRAKNEWLQISVENFENSIKECHEQGSPSEHVMLTMNDYLWGLLSKYLPINSTTFPSGCIQHIAQCIIVLNKDIFSTGKNNGVYPSAPLLQTLIQYIMAIDNITVRNQAIEELVSVVCTSDSLAYNVDVVLEDSLQFDVKIETVRGKEVVIPVERSESRSYRILREMIQHCKDVQERNITKEQISHSPSVRSLYNSLFTLHDLLERERIHLSISQETSQNIVNIDELKQILCNIIILTEDKSALYKVQATPEIRQIYTSISSTLQMLVQSMSSRKDLFVLKRIIEAIKPLHGIVDKCEEENINSLILVERKIEECRDRYIGQYDSRILQNIISKIQAEEHIPRGVVEEVQLTLHRLFPNRQHVEDVDTELFTHFIYEMLEIAYPYISRYSVQNIDKNLPTYIVPIIQVILQHLYSMRKEVAQQYYWTLLDILTFARIDETTGVSKQHLSIGEVLTDTTKDGSTSHIERPYAKTLEKMLEISQAVICGNDTIPKKIYIIKRLYDRLVQLLGSQTQDTELLVSTMSTLSQYIMALKPSELESSQLLLDLPFTLEGIIDSLLEHYPQINKMVRYQFAEAMYMLYEKVESQNSQLMFKLQLEKDKKAEMQIDKSAYTQMTASVLSDIIRVEKEHFDIEDIASYIVRSYMSTYFVQEDAENSVGVVKHLVEQIMLVRGIAFDVIEDGLNEGTTYKGELLHALLRYLHESIDDKVMLELAFQECKSVLCESDMSSLYMPILKQEVIESIDVEEDNIQGMVVTAKSLFGESIHSKIVNELHAIHSKLSSNTLPQAQSRAVVALHELMFVKNMITSKGSLTDYVRELLDVSLENIEVNGVLSRTSLSQYLTSEHASALSMNLLIMLSLVKNKDDIATIRRLLNYSLVLCKVEIPNPIACYLELKNSDENITIIDGAISSLWTILESDCMKESTPSQVNAVLMSLTRLIKQLQAYPTLLSNINTQHLRDMQRKMLSYDYDKLPQYKNALFEFFKALIDDEQLKNTAVLSEVQSLMANVETGDEEVEKLLSELISLSYVSDDSRRKSIDIRVIRSLEEYPESSIYKVMKQLCSQYMIKQIAYLLLEHRIDADKYNHSKEDIKAIEMLLQVIEALLEELGDTVYLVVKDIMHANNPLILLKNMAKEDIDPICVKLLYKSIWGLQEQGVRLSLLGENLSSEEVKRALRRYLELGFISTKNSSMKNKQKDFLCKAVAYTHSLEWQDMIQHCSKLQDKESILLEGIRSLYQYGVQAVEKKNTESLREYIKLLASFASAVGQSDKKVIDASMRMNLLSLCSLVSSLKKSDKKDIKSYNALLGYCRLLLNEEDYQTQEKIRVATSPSYMTIECTIAEVTKLVDYIWRNIDLTPVHELETLLERLALRLQAIDKNMLSKVISPILLQQLKNKLVSFTEDISGDLLDIVNTLIDECTYVLDYICLESVGMQEWMQSKTITNNTEEVAEMIQDWCSDNATHTNQESLIDLYHLIQSVDKQKVSYSAFISLVHTMLNSDWCYKIENQDICARILAEVLYVLPPQECRAEILYLQKVLFKDSTPYNWLVIQHQYLKNQLLSPKDEHTVSRIQTFVKEYLDAYIPKTREEKYPAGVIQHLLKTAKKVEQYDHTIPSSCAPSVFCFRAEVLKAVLDYVQSVSLPLPTLQKLYNEISHYVCIQESYTRKIPIYNSAGYGKLDYVYECSGLSAGKYVVRSNVSSSENSYTQNIMNGLYKIRQRVFPDERYSPECFVFLHSLYTLAKKDSLVKHGRLEPHYASILHDLENAVRAHTLDEELLEHGNKNLLIAIVKLLSQEKSLYQEAESSADLLIEYCLHLLQLDKQNNRPSTPVFPLKGEGSFAISHVMYQCIGVLEDILSGAMSRKKVQEVLKALESKLTRIKARKRILAFNFEEIGSALEDFGAKLEEASLSRSSLLFLFAYLHQLHTIIAPYGVVSTLEEVKETLCEHIKQKETLAGDRIAYGVFAVFNSIQEVVKKGNCSDNIIEDIGKILLCFDKEMLSVLPSDILKKMKAYLLKIEPMLNNANVSSTIAIVVANIDSLLQPDTKDKLEDKGLNQLLSSVLQNLENTARDAMVSEGYDSMINELRTLVRELKSSNLDSQSFSEGFLKGLVETMNELKQFPLGDLKNAIPRLKELLTLLQDYSKVMSKIEDVKRDIEKGAVDVSKVGATMSTEDVQNGIEGVLTTVLQGFENILKGGSTGAPSLAQMMADLKELVQEATRLNMDLQEISKQFLDNLSSMLENIKKRKDTLDSKQLKVVVDCLKELSQLLSDSSILKVMMDFVKWVEAVSKQQEVKTAPAQADSQPDKKKDTLKDKPVPAPAPMNPEVEKEVALKAMAMDFLDKVSHIFSHSISGGISQNDFEKTRIIDMVSKQEEKEQLQTCPDLCVKTLKELLELCALDTSIGAVSQKQQPSFCTHLGKLFAKFSFTLDIELVTCLFKKIFLFMEEDRPKASIVFGEILQRILQQQDTTGDSGFLITGNMLQALSFMVSDMVARENMYFLVGLLKGEEKVEIEKTIAYRLFTSMYQYISSPENINSSTGGKALNLSQKLEEMKSLMRKPKILLSQTINREARAKCTALLSSLESAYMQ